MNNKAYCGKAGDEQGKDGEHQIEGAGADGRADGCACIDKLFKRGCDQEPECDRKKKVEGMG